MPVYCFLEISSGFAALPGKVILELFDTQVPKVVENFRALCTGEKGGGLHYQGTQFHRIIETFTLQGGDTSGTGTGGSNIYGNDPVAFSGEDLMWRDVDEEMLVCMAETSPRSQFFITLSPSPHLNGQHCCLGKVIRGQDILRRLSAVDVDDDDKPIEPVTISRCGELEYKGPAIKPAVTTTTAEPTQANRTTQGSETSPPDARGKDRGETRRRKDTSTSPRDSSRRSRPRERSVEQHRYRSPERYRGRSRRSRTREEDERLQKQERLREYARYRRDPDEQPDVIYKGRGKMMYQQERKDDPRRHAGRLT